MCWVLKRLFSLPGDNPALIFKGGTSLSKVYGAIRRFSEDIDLSFDRRDLGYVDERDPLKAPSQKKAEALIKDLEEDVIRHIDTLFLPRLREAIHAQLRPEDGQRWTLDKDPRDKQGVLFTYPPSRSAGTYADLDYVRPVVRLELGARSDHWPSERRRIRSYAAEDFQDQFTTPDCEVTVLAAERTFWEKATILHATYHQSDAKKLGERWSRHYYDLALLADTEYGKKALAQLNMLESVVKHKQTFFHAAWANYETARPGSLRLAPRNDQLGALKADYAKMAAMIFDEPPPRFDDLIARIELLEKQVNGFR